MKITNNSVKTHYVHQGEQHKAASLGNSDKKIKSFDEVIIRAKAVMSQEKFATELSSQISREVRTSASPQKLDDLRSQIESGTYQIGLDEVLKKMLLH